MLRTAGSMLTPPHPDIVLRCPVDSYLWEVPHQGEEDENMDLLLSENTAGSRAGQSRSCGLGARRPHTRSLVTPLLRDLYRDHNVPPQDMPHWHKNEFEPKATGN